MALSDWDFFSGGSPTFALQTVGALVDTASLEIVSPATGRIQGQLDSGQTRGFTKGKIRSLFRCTANTGTALNSNIGLWCLSSVENMIGTGSGDAYGVGIAPAASANVRLRKIDQNFGEWFDDADLAVANKSFIAGTTVAMELEWNVDIPGIGGVNLVVRVGDATDFSDLSEVINIVDSSSPYTTGFAEGIWAATESPATATFLVDNTEIFVGV